MRIKINLPQTFRVWSTTPDAEGFNVLIVPDPRVCEGFRDFYLMRDGYGAVIHMFGCVVESDEEAAELALANMPYYYDDPSFVD